MADRPAPRRGVALPAGDLISKQGLYRNETTFEPLRLVVEDNALRIERGAALVPRSATEFDAGGRRFTFDNASNGARPHIAETADVVTTTYVPVADFKPTAADLAPYVGSYHSDDAETSLTIETVGAALIARRRPASRLPLTTIYADVFDSQLGLIRFIRNSNGAIVELSIRQGRVYDMRFQRLRH